MGGWGGGGYGVREMVIKRPNQTNSQEVKDLLEFIIILSWLIVIIMLLF